MSILSEQVINISLPVKENILISLKDSKLEFANDILYLSALSFYQKNKLSLGKAAELAELDKIDFIKKLQYDGEVVFDYSDDEINEFFGDMDTIH